MEITHNESVDVNPRNEHLNHNDDYDVDRVADGHKEEPSCWLNNVPHNSKDESNDDNNLREEQQHSKYKQCIPHNSKDDDNNLREEQ